MFEKYFIDSLVCGKVDDSIPISMSNTHGCISIESAANKSYDVILFHNGNRYIDINHPERIINIIECPQNYMPYISRNGHLYILNVYTLVRYRDVLDDSKKDCKSLMRLPLKKVKYFK